MQIKKKNEYPGIYSRVTHLKFRFHFIHFCILLLVFMAGCAQREVQVFCIGDSTMSHYDLKEMEERYGGADFPRRGWGMLLSSFLNDKATVKNLAVSGRSSKSFRAEGYWDKVTEQIREGDFVIIQFGHNDEKSEDPKRYTEPFGTFKENLIEYAKEAEALGAHALIATPIARRRFDEGSKLVDTHGDYVKASREAAHEAGVPLIDLNKLTMDYLSNLGVEDSKALFLHIEPGEFEKLPEGMEDNTHLSKKGACAVSEMFSEGLGQSKSPLKHYLLDQRPDCKISL
ncbi:MAG: rhamnogalacturonan acetylesterase [Cytophagales bacterium]|uniref:rhamnogalacturonan acetylesterase n=1 Tax=Cyclobacterium marinum TaxID=104 RepID=UPI0030D8E95A|nr:rhamnogalacturonan acetylesterase [Cytophagales bacterium]